MNSENLTPIQTYMEKHEKIFLSETIWHRTLIFGMNHHLVDLYQVCLIMPPWPKMVTCFTYAYIGRNMKKSCLKPQGLEP